MADSARFTELASPQQPIEMTKTASLRKVFLAEIKGFRKFMVVAHFAPRLGR